MCVWVYGTEKKKPQMNADAAYLPTRWRSTLAIPMFSYPQGKQGILISIQRITSSLSAESTELRPPCSVKYMLLILAFDYIGTT